MSSNTDITDDVQYSVQLPAITIFEDTAYVKGTVVKCAELNDDEIIEQPNRVTDLDYVQCTVEWWHVELTRAFAVPALECGDNTGRNTGRHDRTYAKCVQRHINPCILA